MAGCFPRLIGSSSIRSFVRSLVVRSFVRSFCCVYIYLRLKTSQEPRALIKLSFLTLMYIVKYNTRYSFSFHVHVYQLMHVVPFIQSINNEGTQLLFIDRSHTDTHRSHGYPSCKLEECRSLTDIALVYSR